MKENLSTSSVSEKAVPVDSEGFAELGERLVSEGRWEELLQAYIRSIQAYPDLDCSSGALEIMGDIARTRLSDTAKAIEFYREALLASPENSRALEGLAEALEAEGDYEGQAIALERRARAERGGLEADLYAAAGMAFLKVGRRDRAVIALGDALKRAPGRLEIAQKLFEQLMELGRFQSAADVLEAIRNSGDDEVYAERAREFIRASMDVTSLRERAAGILEDLKKSFPDDEETNRLSEEFHELESPEGIKARIESLTKTAFQGDDRRAQARACLSLAQMVRLAASAGDAGSENAPSPNEEFRARIAQALSLWPGMPQAFDVLEDAAKEDDDWAGCVDFLRTLASETEDRTARTILIKRLAVIQIVRMSDDVAAMETLSEACAACPGNLELSTMAAELLIEHSRFQEASDLLASQARVTESSPRREALFIKLADLHQKQMQDALGAAAWFEKALELSPGNTAALSALEKIYEAEGEPERLLKVHDRQLKVQENQDRRFELLGRMADLAGELLDWHEQALDYRCRALSIHPEDTALAEQIFSEAEGLGAESLESAANAFLKAARNAPAEAAEELVRRAARIYAGPLGRAQTALGLWKAVLSIDPSDEEARAAVADLLDRLAAAGNIDQLVASASDNEECAALIRQEIERCEAESDESAKPGPDTMWALYSKLSESGDLTPGETARMMDLARSQGRWEDLARLCARAAAGEQDPGRRADLKFARASVLSGKLGRSEDACIELLSALQDEGATPRLTDSLKTLADEGVMRQAVAEALLPAFQEEGNAEKAAWALTILAGGTRDTATRLELYLKLSEIYEGMDGRSRMALSWMEKAVRLTPSSAEVRSKAEMLAQRSGAQAELASLYIEVARGEEGGAASRAVLLTAADLAAGASEFDLAIQALDMVLSKGGDKEAYDRLLDCARRAGRPAERLRALQGIVAMSRTGGSMPPADAQGGDELSPVRLELCEVLEGMGQYSEAQHILEEHLERSGQQDASLLQWLERLCAASGDSAGAQHALSLQIELAESAGNTEEASGLRIRFSQLIEAAGDADGAIAQYAKVLAAKPDDTEAIAALERMYDNPELRGAAAHVLDAACQASHDHAREARAVEILESEASDPGERISLLRRLARIYSVDLHMPELAFAALAKALPLAPEDVQIRIAARRMAESADALESYVEILEEAQSSLPGPEGIPLLRDMADVYERKLGDHDCALDCLRRIRALAPDDVDALKGIHSLYRRMDMPEELAEVSETLGRIVLDDQERRRFWRDAGKLYEEKLSNSVAAARAWRSLAESDPLDREAAMALDRLYTALERPADLAFALELRRAQEGDGSSGREVTYRLAVLKKDVLDDSRGALELFQKVLAADPSHPETLDALENWVRSGTPGYLEALAVLDPVLAQSGEHGLRVALREAVLNSAPSGLKPRIAAEIRSICEVNLGDADRAFMAACQHFSAGIDREGTFPEMDRLARLTDNADVFADVCEEALEVSGLGDELKLRILRRTASLRESLGENDQAAALYRRILEEIPADKAAFAALDRLYEGSGNADALAEACLKQLSQEMSPEGRRELQMKAAQTLLNANRTEEAIEQARSVLVSDPGSIKALSLLEKAHGRLGQWREQADVLRSLCEKLPSRPERENAALVRARLLEEKGEPAEAIDAYSQLLQSNPGDQRAVSALENLFGKERTRPLAARVLEAHYRASADNRRLCEVLEVKASLSSRQERAEVLLELARLREEIGERPVAFATLLRVLAENEPDAALLDSLERIAAEMGSFEELAASYEDALDRLPVDDLSIELRRRLAAIYDERLGDSAAAAAAYEMIAESRPDDIELLDILLRIYRRSGMDNELLRALWRRSSKEEDPAKRIKLLFEIASVSEERVDEPAQAIDALKAILEISPMDQQAVPALSRLLEKTERFPELADLTVKCIESAEAEGRAEYALELRVKLGCIRRDHLADPRGGLSAFTAVLYKRPGHPGAVAELEKMAQDDGPLRSEAALALQPVFENTGDDSKLVQMLEARAQTAEPAEKASLLYRIAQLYSGTLGNMLGNIDMAFLYAGRALEADPDNLEILQETKSMASAAGTSEEFAELLDTVIPSTRTEEARIAMLRILGEIQAEDGTQDREAAETYRRLVEMVPGDQEALDALETIFRRNGNWPEVCETLRAKLEAAGGDVRKSTELKRMLAAVQQEELGDDESAVATLRKLLEEAPDDLSALERLEKIFESSRRHAELADVLSRETEICRARGEVEKALALTLRHAVLRSEKLMDRDGAMTLFSDFLRERPRNTDAIDHLARLAARDYSFDPAGDLLAESLAASGQNQRLAELLEERAAASLGQRRLDFLVECARLRIQFGRSDLAFISLCQAHREDPTNKEVRELLLQTASQSDTLEELAELYNETIVRLDGEDALDVSLTLGSIYEKLRDPMQAARCYEMARRAESAPSCRALKALLRIYTEADDSENRLSVLQSLADEEEDASVRAEEFYEIGVICQTKLEPPSSDRAAQAYEQALALDGTHLKASAALADLYQAARIFDRLMEILEAQRALLQGAALEKLLERMASVAEEGLGDTEKAISLYEELLKLAPRSQTAYAALERLYESTGRDEPLVSLLQNRISSTVEPRELLRLYDKKGRALARQGRDAEAIQAFQSALDRDPRTVSTLEALRSLREKEGSSEDLALVLRRLIPLQDSTQGVKSMRLRFAEVLADIGKRTEALDAARRILDLEPHTVDEMRRVGDLFMKLQSPADQVHALELEAMALIEDDDEEKALEIFYAIAEIQAEQLNKPLAAAASYERILDVNPASRDAFDRIREIYASLKEWRKLGAVYERYIAAVTDPSERLELEKELIQLQEEKLGQRDVAFITCCRAFSESPTDAAICSEAHRLAAETDNFEALASIYEEVLEGMEKGPDFVRMSLDYAAILDGHLDDADGAEDACRRVLEYDPTSIDALNALAGMFERRGRDADFVTSLEHKLDLAPTIEEKKRLLSQIAQAQDCRLNSLEDASSALLRSLELEPDRETFRALADLFRKYQNRERCVEILERARDFEVDPKDKARIQVEISEILERELGDDDAAVAGFRLALEFEPDNRDALAALERIFTRLDRAAELLEVYRILISLSDEGEAVHLYFKSAAIWQDKLRNLERADGCLKSVLEIEPENIQAVKGLESIRKLDAEAHRPETRRWEDLLEIFDYHLGLEKTMAGQVAILVEKGRVCMDELGRSDDAFEAFGKALEIDPVCREAVHALAVLHENAAEFDQALEMLRREGELLGRTKNAAAVFCRMGTIHLERLDSPKEARRDWSQALELDPSSLDAIRALQKLDKEEENWDGYIDMVVRETECAQEISERIDAHLRAAAFYEESRSDDENASNHYEKALALDGTLVAAARPLSDICVAAQKWERAEQLLDIVVGGISGELSSDPQLAGDLCRQLYRLGYVCEKLGKEERALGAYERAYQLDSTYLPSAEGYANRLVATDRWADAISVYQAILIHHSEELTDLEIVDIYWQQGELYRKMGQDDRARKEFERALSHDSQHDPSLRSMAEISEAQERWDEALKYLDRLSEFVEEKERFEIYLKAGIIARDRLNDPYHAIDDLSRAREIEPSSVKVLDLLLGLYTGTHQSAKAAEILETLISLIDASKEPNRACRFHCALGEVCRDGLRDIDRAAKAFNDALDIDYRFIQAFAALESMLGESRKWDMLEQNYQRMLQRIPKRPETHDARMAIFKALAGFYENVRRDLSATLQIYRMLAKGMPGNGEILEKYARLAAASPGLEAEAREAYRAALPYMAEPQKAVHSIARLSARARDYDAAYVAAQVSQYILGDVGADEREILTKLSPYAQRREQPRRPLTDALWARIYHPRLKGPMGQILAFIQGQLGDFFAHRHSVFGIDAKAHRVDQSGQEFALNTYRYIANVCGMSDLALYSPYLVTLRERMKRGQNAVQQMVHPDKDRFLDMVHVNPVALKAGGALFSETDHKRMAFQMVREMTFCRPEMVLARMLPAARLDALFQAAIYYTVPGYQPTADLQAIEAEGSILANLQSHPQFLAALSQLCQKYVKTAAEDDLRTYIEAVELTADRAAALVCSDIRIAMEMLKADTNSRLPLRSRVRDLLLFCMSPDFSALRTEIDLAIQVRVPGSK